MAVLPDADRADVTAKVQRHWSTLTLPCGITKAQLREAVNAIDDWVDANATSFNNAIPQPQRGILSSDQKAWLLDFVVRKRIADL